MEKLYLNYFKINNDNNLYNYIIIIMFNINRQKKTLSNNVPGIQITSNASIQRQAQCSTLPNQQPSSNPRNKVELLPDHGPLNWLQLYEKQNIKIKIILMKVITILISVFENDEYKKVFIKDNELKNPDQTDFLIYLHEQVFKKSSSNHQLLTNIQSMNDFRKQKISIFEKKGSDAESLYNPVFEQILKVIDMNTLTELFSFKTAKSSTQMSFAKTTKPAGLKIRPEFILNNYNLKNVNLFWMCLDRRVYYITPYFLYHPGGDSILLRLLTSSRNTVERVDKMKEFQKYHRWVNETDLLSSYIIGYV